MPHNPNTSGGGAQTNANGLFFEQTTDLNDVLEKVGYTIENCKVYKDEEFIGYSVPKRKLYKFFLEPNGVDFRELNSKAWEPDDCFINVRTKTAFIIEKKFQNCSGSVDEKLPGCDFKKKEYQKLFNKLEYKTEFIYVFNNWFLQPVYKDTLEYIKEIGCICCFNEIPLKILGL